MSDDPELLNPPFKINILSILVTFSTFHDPIFWLNASAFLNISCIVIPEAGIWLPVPIVQSPTGWLKLVAFSNILAKLLHEIGLQLFMSDDPELLNAVAFMNSLFMLVTLLTSHDPKFWLNIVALANIVDIVTFRLLPVPIVQFPIGWLNAVADWNMPLKLLHEIGLQLFISLEPPLLKAVAPKNILNILVTALVSQDPILWLNDVAW